jgi:hypothetical protein
MLATTSKHDEDKWHQKRNTKIDFDSTNSSYSLIETHLPYFDVIIKIDTSL